MVWFMRLANFLPNVAFFGVSDLLQGIIRTYPQTRGVQGRDGRGVLKVLVYPSPTPPPATNCPQLSPSAIPLSKSNLPFLAPFRRIFANFRFATKNIGSKVLHTRCPTKIVLSSIWNLSHASTGLSLVSQLIGIACIVQTPKQRRFFLMPRTRLWNGYFFLVIKIIQEKKITCNPSGCGGLEKFTFFL